MHLLPGGNIKQGLPCSWLEGKIYLWVPTAKYINHDLHDSFMHAQSSHQVGVLIENFITHDVPKERQKKYC